MYMSRTPWSPEAARWSGVISGYRGAWSEGASVTSIRVYKHVLYLGAYCLIRQNGNWLQSGYILGITGKISRKSTVMWKKDDINTVR